MNRVGKSVSSLVIAGISILLVAGALITTLAQSGFSPTPYSPPTNTAIQIGTQSPQDTVAFTPTASEAVVQEATQAPSQTVNQDPSSTPTAGGTSENVPTATPGTVCKPPSDWIKYTVQSGDTLYSIAILFQTTYRTLQTGNCMSGSRIYTGDILYVPNNATITPTTKPTNAPTNTKAPTKTYTPSPSDTPVPPTATFTATPIPTTPTCYALTLTYTGSGSDPTPDILNSSDCSVGHYIEGEVITLTAHPTGILESWDGTDGGTNILTMPASDHIVTANYNTP